MPQINLVPMLDVLMSVLTFFILTSMAMTGQKLGDILLPGTESGAKAKEEKPLVIGLQKDGKVLLEGNPQAGQADIEKAMKAYIEKNKDGTVILKADRELSYQEVDNLLKRMMKIGGGNVSLAIERG
ncbi:biopolymer transporter ExbD [Oscillatoria sp. FACHB-1406]|uniref:ExbD/TolR family protein n=1 Tax=Oscillatoria sp. FACHB-1406 TaxID=2692846 RepID=UPI0018F03508|nr:biopolymer transporter ExbD [Oscillatoria sp. FACHB-1406]